MNGESVVSEMPMKAEEVGGSCIVHFKIDRVLDLAWCFALASTSKFRIYYSGSIVISTCTCQAPVVTEKFCKFIHFMSPPSLKVRGM